MLDWIKFWYSETRQWGWRIGWRNLRFELGYDIGGFRHAHNYTDQELRDGEALQLIEYLAQFVEEDSYFEDDCLRRNDA